MNQTDQFLKELEENQEGTNDILNQPIVPEKEEQGEDEDPEEAPEERKNRQHRRLEKKLQAEREANIAMAARLEALSEVKKFSSENEDSEYLKQVERIYGTDSPEAQAASELLANSLKAVEERATQRALELFREEQRKAQEAVAKEEQRLDSIVEELEDEYGVTFTPAMERSYFQLMQKLSPKDDQGNVLYYADHHAVWEEFQSKLAKKPDTRAKDLSSRSMVQSGASPDSKLNDDATVRALKEHGII